MLPRASTQVQWAFNTVGRHNSVSKNPTNMAVLSMGESSRKLNCQGLQLTSIHVPKTQLLVEEGINDRLVYQDRAIALTVASQSDLSAIEVHVIANGVQYTSRVMPTLNAILGVEEYDSADDANKDLIVMTEYPHSLGQMGLVTWGKVEIVNSMWSGGPIALDDCNVVVLSETSFRITPTTEEMRRWLLASRVGTVSVWVPAYPSIKDLVGVVRQGFPPLTQYHFSLTFNKYSGQVVFASNSNSNSAPSRTRLELISSPGSLLSIMGFGSRTLSGETIGSYDLPAGYKVIRLPAGNYGHDPARVAAQMQSSLNQFAVTASMPAFSFVDTRQVRHTISIPPGNYSPTTLALHLSQSLNDAESAPGNLYTVTIDADSSSMAIGAVQNNRIVLRNTSSQVWGMDMSQDEFFAFATKFGFPYRTYTGRSSYESQALAYVLGSSSNRVYTVTASKDSPLLNIHVALAQTHGDISLASVNGRTTRVTCHGFAHGLVEGDVVTLMTTSVASDGHPSRPQAPMRVVVGGAERANSFLVHFQSYGFITAVGNIVSIVSTDVPRTSLMFATPQSVQPSLLGFNTMFVDSDDSRDSAIGSSQAMQVQPVPYVLVELVAPSGGSTSMTHALGDGRSIKNNLLAKVDLRDGPSIIEEGTNTQMLFFHLQGITGVQLNLLNPDHTPYQLHGTDWSGTIRMMLI